MEKVTNFITDIRKYRFELHAPVSANDTGAGIALFDTIGTFVFMFIIDRFFLKLSKKTQTLYYLSAIPLGIFTHLVFGQETFLTKQLMMSELNIYHVAIAVILSAIYEVVM
jgi:hypothetical protein